MRKCVYCSTHTTNVFYVRTLQAFSCVPCYAANFIKSAANKQRTKLSLVEQTGRQIDRQQSNKQLVLVAVA